MSWYEQQRMQFIEEMLDIYGFINRRHIERKFGCSNVQAGKDLREYKKENFGRIVFNKNTKRFERPGFREEDHR